MDDEVVVSHNANHNTGDQITIDAVTDPFVIGRNVLIPSFAWQGFIDELGIYNRALSASEIEAIVNRDDASAGEQTTYSVSGDFSRTTNPAGAWSFGTIQPTNPTLFSLFDQPVNSDPPGIDGWHAPEPSFDLSDPAVLHNGTDTTRRSGQRGICVAVRLPGGGRDHRLHRRLRRRINR